MGAVFKQLLCYRYIVSNDIEYLVKPNCIAKFIFPLKKNTRAKVIDKKPSKVSMKLL